MQPFIIIVVFIVLFIVLMIAAVLSSRKRREAMGALAAKLGLQFKSEKDWELARRYQFLDKLCVGSNRYAFNVLSGTYRDYEVTVFDYHYETHSSDSKGHHQTHHHYFSFSFCIYRLHFRNW